MISVSVTDAARGFSDLVNRIRYRRESALLLKGGKPVACLIPIKAGVPASDLADAWQNVPRLGAAEAAAMELDLHQQRQSLKPPVSKWD